MPLHLPKFTHRHNPDGTHDSICHGCFQTIAKVRDETELPRFEKQHACDPYRMTRFRQLDIQDTREG